MLFSAKSNGQGSDDALLYTQVSRRGTFNVCDFVLVFPRSFWIFPASDAGGRTATSSDAGSSSQSSTATTVTITATSAATSASNSTSSLGGSASAGSTCRSLHERNAETGCAQWRGCHPRCTHGQRRRISTHDAEWRGHSLWCRWTSGTTTAAAAATSAHDRPSAAAAAASASAERCCPVVRVTYHGALSAEPGWIGGRTAATTTTSAAAAATTTTIGGSDAIDGTAQHYAATERDDGYAPKRRSGPGPVWTAETVAQPAGIPWTAVQRHAGT